MKHIETILEALEFERDHWQTRHDRRLPAKNSEMKVWMRKRIAHLDEVILDLTKEKPLDPPMTDEEKSDQWWQSNTR